MRKTPSCYDCDNMHTYGRKCFCVCTPHPEGKCTRPDELIDTENGQCKQFTNSVWDYQNG